MKSLRASAITRLTCREWLWMLAMLVTLIPPAIAEEGVLPASKLSELLTD